MRIECMFRYRRVFCVRAGQPAPHPHEPARRRANLPHVPLLGCVRAWLRPADAAHSIAVRGHGNAFAVPQPFGRYAMCPANTALLFRTLSGCLWLGMPWREWSWGACAHAPHVYTAYGKRVKWDAPAAGYFSRRMAELRRGGWTASPPAPGSSACSPGGLGSMQSCYAGAGPGARAWLLGCRSPWSRGRGPHTPVTNALPGHAGDAVDTRPGRGTPSFYKQRAQCREQYLVCDPWQL